MVPLLQEILEREFRLQYQLHMTQEDCENCDASELVWKYGRLAQQKKNEEKMKERK